VTETPYEWIKERKRKVGKKLNCEKVLRMRESAELFNPHLVVFFVDLVLCNLFICINSPYANTSCQILSNHIIIFNNETLLDLPVNISKTKLLCIIKWQYLERE